jgi:hypothetical protein
MNRRHEPRLAIAVAALLLSEALRYIPAVP